MDKDFELICGRNSEKELSPEKRTKEAHIMICVDGVKGSNVTDKEFSCECKDCAILAPFSSENYGDFFKAHKEVINPHLLKISIEVDGSHLLWIKS